MANLYNDALQAVATAAAARFPGAGVQQCAFELDLETLFGDPEKWPTADVPCVAVFDGPMSADEPRARGPIADLQTFQEGDGEIVAGVRGADFAALSIAARQARADLIDLVNQVAIANPYSSSGYTLEWLVAEVKVSKANTGFYCTVRVRFRVSLEE